MSPTPEELASSSLLYNGEQFVMRWQLEGDTLVLERDDALGGVPTPYIVKPWTRAS